MDAGLHKTSTSPARRVSKANGATGPVMAITRADEAYQVGSGKGPVEAYLDIAGIVALATGEPSRASTSPEISIVICRDYAMELRKES